MSALRFGLTGVRGLRGARTVAAQNTKSATFASLAVRKAKEDTRQIGEWPEFERAQAETISPFKYWDKQDRRNHGDTVHENDDIKSIWMVSTVGAGGAVQPAEALGQLIAVLGVMATVYFGAKAFNSTDRKPTGPREMIKEE